MLPVHLVVLAFFFQPAPPSTVTGTVVNSITGEPLAQTRVSLAPAGSMVTGSDGRFRFDDLKTGMYSLRAEHVGFVAQSYGQHELYEQLSTGLAVGERQSSLDLVFRIIPSSVITGHVLDSKGDPVTGVSIQVLKIAGSGEFKRMVRAASGTTDDRGYYRIASLAAGSYAIIANAGGRDLESATPTTYPLTFFPGTTNPSAATLVRVDPGQEASGDMTLRAVPAVSVECEVSGFDRSKGVSAVLTAPGVFGFAPAFSAARFPLNGNAIFSNVPAGHYIVNLTVNGTFVSATPIDVGPGATKATLGSPLLAQVSLRIAVDGKPANPSSPLLGQLLSYRLLGSLRSASVVRNEPVIFTNVPSGRYEVKASQGGPYAISSLKVNGVAQAGVMVEVPEAGNVRIEAIADASASDVTGRLLVNDRPKGGTIVMLVQRDAWQRAGAYRFDQSASDGTFVWRNVSQGEYLMFAFEDGVPADYDDPDTIRRMLPIAQPLKVGDSAPKIELKFLPLPSAK